MVLPFVVALVNTRSVERSDVDKSHEGIRCPQCRWRPSKDDRWYCDCGQAWNTFETRARCPACQKQWTYTECLRCSGWSPHEDWYERDSEKQ